MRFKSVFASLLTSAVLTVLPLTARAAADTFLQFTDSSGVAIKGASADKNHPGWSEVEHWSWQVSAESSFVKGTGAAVGKAQPGPFIWTQSLDAAYPRLFTQLVKGTSSKTVTLDVVKGLGGKAPESFFSMVFSDVFYTKLAVAGSAGGTPGLNGEFVFKQMSMSYKPLDPLSGKLGQAVTASWNVATNTTGQSFYEFSGDPMALVGLSEAMALSVPEPQTWLLMLGGLAVMGALSVRRKTRPLVR